MIYAICALQYCKDSLNPKQIFQKSLSVGGEHIRNVQGMKRIRKVKIRTDNEP